MAGPSRPGARGGQGLSPQHGGSLPGGLSALRPLSCLTPLPMQPEEAASKASGWHLLYQTVEAGEGRPGRGGGGVAGRGGCRVCECVAEWGGRQKGHGGSLSQPRQYSPPRTPSLLHWALALLSFNQYQVDW